MALVNQVKREINAKIVFFGPDFAGKATNLKHVFGKLKPEFRGTLKSMNVQDARMLFFDFTPPGDGNLQGFQVRIHVYTISGQVTDPAVWKMVLKGVDGLVFVADAASHRRQANRDSLDNLVGYLQGYGQSLSSVPLVFQFNKSDLPGALDAAELNRVLNPSRLPSFTASSQSGEGVLQTLLGLVKTVLGGLRNKGLEGIGGSEVLQGMVETPAVPPASAFDQALNAARFEAPSPIGQSPVPPHAPPAPLASEAFGPIDFPDQDFPSAEFDSVELGPAELGPEFQPHDESRAQEPEEPLSLELSGPPQATRPGWFRLPLTIRAGARSKSVVLNLEISLEEE
jgi:signal recognition particle receptor subunit beta